MSGMRLPRITGFRGRNCRLYQSRDLESEITINQFETESATTIHTMCLRRKEQAGVCRVVPTEDQIGKTRVRQTGEHRCKWRLIIGRLDLLSFPNKKEFYPYRLVQSTTVWKIIRKLAKLVKKLHGNQ